ncbi:type II toxin-antitoxin system RelE/ParE family toxin [Asticcacaulis sp. DW145]|jgi:toxin ParE1/3/4|uniref:Toxin n=1 Tax=Asticcacaulis currens TaxID=2984210 RepID=A0ABT5IEV0_9CAUL|nr:type II toxin-antitoxin system RelE/ParE family toxin [Asticcacaulis currens]MDC7694001.1 type II toxin-antitoxin system RelE/ParE family toxin [Asticcacaulis currens]BEV10053.1 type II toxin-antitoxin system RelE/ParE family toxin [Asticcacaulis sp. DW145]
MAEAYSLRPAAQADLRDIWLYSRRQWSADQADRYTLLIAAAFDDLAAGRRKGKPVNVRTGYLKYACGSHIIYFRLNDGLDIVRILHQRMDVETHL